MTRRNIYARPNKSVALSHSQLGLPLFHFSCPKHSHRYLPKEDDIHPEKKLPIHLIRFHYDELLAIRSIIIFFLPVQE